MPEGGEQAGGHGDHGGPGDVDLPVPRGPPVQPDRLGLLDVGLDVDVGAVTGVRPGDLPGGGVDGDQLVAPSATSPAGTQPPDKPLTSTNPAA
jgi:hypothetical protein